MALNVKNILKFLEIVGCLKTLCRTGWVQRGIANAETVGDHSLGMALMALQKEGELKSIGVDVKRVIEMCLLHDVGECIIGDIVPLEHQVGKIKVSGEEKKIRELEAINYLAATYDFYKLKNLFVEYEEQKTLEAIIVKHLDKLDMLLQAYEYILEYDNCSLNEFMEFNEKDIRLIIFKEDLEEIKRRQYYGKMQKNEFIDLQLQLRKLKSIKKEYECEKCARCSVASHCFRCGIIAIYLEDELEKMGIDVFKIVKHLLVKDIDRKQVDNLRLENFEISYDEVSFIKDIDAFEGICQLKDSLEALDWNGKEVSIYRDLIQNDLILKLID